MKEKEHLLPALRFFIKYLKKYCSCKINHNQAKAIKTSPRDDFIHFTDN